MKICITGVNGFLGNYFIEQLLKSGHQVIATNRGQSKVNFAHENFIYEEMDFTDAALVNAILQKHQPAYVIHSGAMSKPDDCEKNKPLADKINIDGTAIMLQAAKAIGAGFLFMSTDFIFDGATGMYTETATTNPVNYYGETKVKAEALVTQYEHNWSIVRTVLVYGKPYNKRNNILTIVREKLENGESYDVFNDQVRTPTYAQDLAKAIVSIIEKKATGIYNICGKDVLTPYDMAVATANYLQLDASLIKKITAKDFVQPAKRPPITGLDISKAKNDLGYEPISFEEGLRRTLA
ncbi:MAG: SDR family oxidoreductase [Ferruginibacter sp.]